MRSLHQIVSDNRAAVAAGTSPTNLYLGERADPGFPWTVVLSIADDGTTLYTVVNNEDGVALITTRRSEEAHAVARANNLIDEDY